MGNRRGTVQVLGNGVLYKPQLLALGQWDIYEVDLTYESSTVLVELHRMLGSPYLIFKRNDVGYEPYGLPAPDDISEYADKEGATGSLDYHHVLRINQTVRLAPALSSPPALFRSPPGFPSSFPLFSSTVS